MFLVLVGIYLFFKWKKKSLIYCQIKKIQPKSPFFLLKIFVFFSLLIQLLLLLFFLICLFFRLIFQGEEDKTLKSLFISSFLAYLFLHHLFNAKKKKSIPSALSPFLSLSN